MNFIPEPFSYFYYGNPFLRSTVSQPSVINFQQMEHDIFKKKVNVVPILSIPSTHTSPQISPRTDLRYKAVPYSPSGSYNASSPTESFFELSDSDDTMEEIEPLCQRTFEPMPKAPHSTRRKRTFKKFI
jgi:hypothetical protein